MNISSTMGIASRNTARLIEPCVKSCCVPLIASTIVRQTRAVGLEGDSTCACLEDSGFITISISHDESATLLIRQKDLKELWNQYGQLSQHTGSVWSNVGVGYEAMNINRKAQIRWLPNGDVFGQIEFINRAFGLPT